MQKGAQPCNCPVFFTIILHWWNLKDPQTWFKSMSNEVFFTRVFTGRCTSYEKSTKASPKILLVAKYWVAKSIFSPTVSQKPKTEVVFFLSALTLNWRHSWKSASVCALSQRIKQHARYKMRVLTRKSKARTTLASSYTCLQRLILQNCVLEKVCFLND